MPRLRTAVRIMLGFFLVFAGVSHLTFARKDFRAQVPEFVPLDVDTTVALSGAAEIALGTALVTAPHHRLMGWLTAGFFAAVFPGNVSQWRNHRDAFGLDTDRKRLLRLPFQAVLITVALWSSRTD
ncbi:MauE/DoxX family redox-associated membrane protein [Microbacterium sp.]|uniref:DoxX family protein n=1 Tax=Microbacterium sp. TaxID=51671 RepID=UPI00344C7231